MPHVNVASAMVEGARLRLRRPVSSLRAYVGCFWSIETTPATRLRTLPDACATLSIESSHSKALECFLVGSEYASSRALLLCSSAYQSTHLSSAVYD